MPSATIAATDALPIDDLRNLRGAASSLADGRHEFAAAIGADAVERWPPLIGFAVALTLSGSLWWVVASLVGWLLP